MINVLLVFTSMTGNTKEMANAIADGIRTNVNTQLTLIDIYDQIPEDLITYDCIIIGCYTDGEGEIPYEMLDFYEDFGAEDLTSIVVGLFGSGDSCYEYFCGALDTFEHQLKKRGAIQPLSPLKVELEPSKQELEICHQFAINLLQYVPNVNIP